MDDDVVEQIVVAVMDDLGSEDVGDDIASKTSSLAGSSP